MGGGRGKISVFIHLVEIFDLPEDCTPDTVTTVSWADPRAQNSSSNSDKGSGGKRRDLLGEITA